MNSIRKDENIQFSKPEITEDIKSVITNFKNRTITFEYLLCPVCKQEQIAAPIRTFGHCLECEEEKQKKITANRSASLASKFKIPPKWEKTENTPLPSQKKAYESSLDWLKSHSGWLYIYGPVGVGKTHLAATIANYLQKDGPVAWISYTDYVFQSFVDKNQLFDQLKNAHAVIIDGFAAVTKVPVMMTNIFEYYLNFKKTNLIFTSSTYLLGKQKIDGTYPPYDKIDRHIADRLIEGISIYVLMQGINLRVPSLE